MWKGILILALIVTACASDNSTEEDNKSVQSSEKPENSDSLMVSDSANDTDKEKTNQNETSSYSYKVIYDEKTGWGYQIYDGSNMVINQMHIPAVQGIQGFDSRNKAEKTADYVLKQIEKGNFPPTLSKEILDSLDVL